MSRSRRYLLIFGLIALAVLIGLTWKLVQNYFPNAFDREVVNEAEVEKLQAADLSRPDSASRDWPQFYGPTRDGYVPAADLNTDWEARPPKVIWSAPCGGGYSSLAIVGGRVYTQDKLDDRERVICLDAETGQTRWVHEYQVGYRNEGQNYMKGPRATPTVHDGRVYAVGATGRFVCLTAADDKPQVLWEHDLMAAHRAEMPQWGVACSPLIEGDLVIVQPGGKGGSLVAYDRVSGEQRWACESEPTGYSSPIAATLGGVRHVLAVTAKSVLGIRASDGKLLWKMPFETRFGGNVAMPVAAGDFVFVSANYDKGCACYSVTPTGPDEAAAKVAYFRPNKVMRNHTSTSVHKDGFVYGFDNQTLRCVNLRDGTAVEDWPGPDVANRFGKGSLILAGDHLIGLTERGSLFLGTATPDEFELRGRMEGVLDGSECWAVPALLDGRLYLRDAGKVVCLDLRK